MEFIDGCIRLSIKQLHITQPSNILSKSFTVIKIQNYEVSLKFHSKQFTRFLRYRQFFSLNSKIPKSVHLPPFPKKSLFESSAKLRDSRKLLLEKWLQGLLLYPDTKIMLLGFLSIPAPIIFSVKNSEKCELSYLDKIVANFVRKIGIVEKSRVKILKEFSEKFFECQDFCVNEGVFKCFFEHFSPLCGMEDTANEAIDILFKMLRVDFYLFSDVVKKLFLRNIKWVKMIKLDKHILNGFNNSTRVQGFYIIKLVREYMGEKVILEEVLINCEEALNVYYNNFRHAREKNELKQGLNEDNYKWSWLSTQKFCETLKIGIRRVEKWVEIKAKLFIDVDYQILTQYIWNLNKRKAWDQYLKDYKLLDVCNNRCQVQYFINSGKNSSVSLVLDSSKVEKHEQIQIKFQSLHQDQKFSCHNSFYKIKHIQSKKSVSSSSTEDFESNDLESQSPNLKLFPQTKNRSKLFFSLKITPDLAKIFVSDLSEETSILKSSLSCLKKLAELTKN